MRAFNVAVNGKPICLAGIGDDGVYLQQSRTFRFEDARTPGYTSEG
ncbi:MAG TPA: hypothetical protein VFW94_13865 [Candidatus Acidoferrales bacterium]|nr:hypothetical protein [Candidatus Acidoferrales bacterium]